VALLLGLWLMRAGRGMRLRRGLGSGRTVALDNVILTSRRLGLTGKPDRLVKGGGTVIPEEWKSALKVWPSHRVQIGTYFLLIEDRLKVRPPHGFIVTRDGVRYRIENTAELRAWAMEVAGRIRAARAAVTQPIRVNQPPAKCRKCGQLGNCGQSRM
jgi:CRISPR-associated exonuclease Cas4